MLADALTTADPVFAAALAEGRAVALLSADGTRLLGATVAGAAAFAGRTGGALAEAFARAASGLAATGRGRLLRARVPGSREIPRVGQVARVPLPGGAEGLVVLLLAGADRAERAGEGRAGVEVPPSPPEVSSDDAIESDRSENAARPIAEPPAPAPALPEPPRRSGRRRLLWRLEEDGAFGLDAEGVAQELVSGAPLRSAIYDPAGAVVAALDAREGFSGVPVVLRLARGELGLPVALSGEPVRDEGRVYRGHRGFALAAGDASTVPVPPPESQVEAEPFIPVASPARDLATQLERELGGARRRSPKPRPAAPARTAPEPGSSELPSSPGEPLAEGQLTIAERTAFREIARALGNEAAQVAADPAEAIATEPPAASRPVASRATRRRAPRAAAPVTSVDGGAPDDGPARAEAGPVTVVARVPADTAEPAVGEGGPAQLPMSFAGWEVPEGAGELLAAPEPSVAPEVSGGAGETATKPSQVTLRDDDPVSLDGAGRRTGSDDDEPELDDAGDTAPIPAVKAGHGGPEPAAGLEGEAGEPADDGVPFTPQPVTYAFQGAYGVLTPSSVRAAPLPSTSEEGFEDDLVAPERDGRMPPTEPVLASARPSDYRNFDPEPEDPAVSGHGEDAWAEESFENDSPESPFTGREGDAGSPASEPAGRGAWDESYPAAVAGAQVTRLTSGQVPEDAATDAWHGAEAAALKALPLAVAVLRGGTVLAANPAFLALTGHADLGEVYAAGGAAGLFEGAVPSPGADGPRSLRLAGRGHAWVEAQAVPFAWTGLPATLITLAPRPSADLAARLAEAEAETARARAGAAELAAALDTATDGVLTLDARGRVLSMNRPAEALFGFDAREIGGESLTVLLAPESHASALDHIEGLRAGGAASLLDAGREVTGRPRGGGAIPLLMVLGRLGEGDDRLCAVLRDLTPGKRFETDLAEARAAAKSALSGKAEVLARVSHEVRTPLNAILGFAEVMMGEQLGPLGHPRYAEYLRDVHASGTTILRLLGDLLDLSRFEAGSFAVNLAPVDANAVARVALEGLQAEAARGRIVLRSSFSPGIPAIDADAGALRRILTNLLSNAVRYTGPGGQVLLSTALDEAGEVVLRVRDTGAGMTEPEIREALAPFTRLPANRKPTGGKGGTGLGLPLTKALVEAHRASLTIRSSKEEGTLVEVAFPAAGQGRG